jgi:hypothetical protein
MARIAMDEGNPAELRLRAYGEPAPFVAARLKSVDVRMVFVQASFADFLRNIDDETTVIEPGAQAEALVEQRSAEVHVLPRHRETG